MADYDSDSSAGEDVATDIVLGYASPDSTDEPFSQLGGIPTWLDGATTPPGSLAKCKVCNGLMNLLLQIRGDQEERFPGHERRLYIWGCRKKTCRRKDGSMRGFRATRHSAVQHKSQAGATKEKTPIAQPKTGLGEALFGVKPSSSGSTNPFSTSSGNASSTNPFSSGGVAADNPFASASSLGAKPPQKPSPSEATPATFAEKARLSSPESMNQTATVPTEPWPTQTAFPTPYPCYNIEPDKEYIDMGLDKAIAGLRVDRDAMDTTEGSSSSADDKLAFESSMDKTFQKFADRLAQNPEQVLRYEFSGQPLLYSKSDAVGKLLAPAQESANVKVKSVSGSSGSRMPRCSNCDAERVFELQLTPHAITELEAEEISVEGMDWGTVILGVCSRDCQKKGKDVGEVGYIEEWVGVQWEELSGSKRPA